MSKLEQAVTYSKVNSILDNIQQYKVITDNKSIDYYKEKNQGEEGERVQILDIGIEDVYLKVVYKSDSYGSNETLDSIRFVTSTSKTVKVYE